MLTVTVSSAKQSCRRPSSLGDTIACSPSNPSLGARQQQQSTLTFSALLLEGSMSEPEPLRLSLFAYV